MKIPHKQYAIEFQRMSEQAYADARLFIDGRDKYVPRARYAQQCGAYYAKLAAEHYAKYIRERAR